MFHNALPLFSKVIIKANKTSLWLAWFGSFKNKNESRVSLDSFFSLPVKNVFDLFIRANRLTRYFIF